MANPPVPETAAPDVIDPGPVQWVKRAVLILTGLPYFLFIAFIPLLCAGRRGFRGWYWRLVKRACSRLLWLLSIRAEISPEDRATLASDTNSIIVINHRSNLDGFALMHVIPDEKWFTFAGKKELFDSRLLRTGFRAAGLVEIDRSSGKVALETLTAAVHAMPTRQSVVLFPEGTRARSETLGEFKAGAVLAARETGRKIRPIVIHNSDRLLGRGKAIPLGGTINVEVLSPFSCDPGASVDEDVVRLRSAMLEAFEAARPPTHT